MAEHLETGRPPGTSTDPDVRLRGHIDAARDHVSAPPRGGLGVALLADVGAPPEGLDLRPDLPPVPRR